jgi:hypothetical protein
VTKLLQHLRDELVRRYDATTTRESYLKILKAFHRRIGKRLDRVRPARGCSCRCITRRFS